MFSGFEGTREDDIPRQDGVLNLMTIRSRDQYNTTIYGLGDRYRGVFGRRDVLLMNPSDLAAAGLEHGDLVDVRLRPRVVPCALGGSPPSNTTPPRVPWRPTSRRPMSSWRLTTSTRIVGHPRASRCL